MISSSIRELVPVVRLDGHTIGSGRPGVMAEKLLEAFHARVLWEAPSTDNLPEATARVDRLVSEFCTNE